MPNMVGTGIRRAEGERYGEGKTFVKAERIGRFAVSLNEWDEIHI